jgi:hypothetical protein
MKRLLLLIALVAAVYVGYDRRDMRSPSSAHSGSLTQGTLGTEANNTQVRGAGVVERTLSDDNDGSRHQRFILRLASGQTLLVAHNIDLAPRVANLRTGDTVEFSGEYEWNEKGGVVHWTPWRWSFRAAPSSTSTLARRCP